MSKKEGLILGPKHKDGGVIIEAEGNEYIIRASSVNPQTRAVLDYINIYGKLPSVNDARKRGKNNAKS